MTAPADNPDAPRPSGTTIAGRYAIRVAIGNLRAGDDHVRRAEEVILAAGHELWRPV